MADLEKASSDSKVFDVTKPAKLTPVTNSKPPTVAKHTMMTSDPADTNKAEADTSVARDSPVSPATAPTVTSKVRIEPISKPEDLVPEADKPAEQTDSTEAEEDAVGEDDNDSDSTGRNTLKDASSDEQEVIDSKAAERQANYDKIVAAKTYFLPINQVVRRRSKRVAIAGAVLIVLLGIAWADISLDAGLITIPGVKAPTNFFSK